MQQDFFALLCSPSVEFSGLMANMALTHILACKEIDVCETVILQMLPSGAKVFMMINFPQLYHSPCARYSKQL